jgi:RNase E specificity factor CsrD
MPHLKCKLALTRYPINPRSNLKDAINDEVLSFITLLTGLTIFVTLIGCSLSFYNAIQDKLVNRVQSVASVIDTRLLTTPLPALSVSWMS